MTFCLGVPLTLPLYLSLQWSKKVYPGAVNSVPRESHVEVDVRDIEEKRRDHVLDMIIKSAEQIADKRQCEMKYRIVNKDPPAPCADYVVAAVQVRPMPFIFPIRPSLLSRLSDPYPVLLLSPQDAADDLGFKSMRMVSRAYHDALFMAQIAPTGMIFVPCKGGVSHRPDEFSSKQDMENGVRTLALAMAKLAGVVEGEAAEGNKQERVVEGKSEL